MEGLITGRIIHYVPRPVDQDFSGIHHAAAIVSNVLSLQGLVSLHAFTNSGLEVFEDIPYDGGLKLPGTWHWVERA